jgi:sugar/nucleoside kinase (ribokinase family)
LAEAAERLLDWGAGVVQVSAGAAGLFVATADEERLGATGRLTPLLRPYPGVRHLEPAVPVSRVSGTTGAGDVATAGFLQGLLEGRGPVAAATLAATAAARHVAGECLEPPQGDS